MSIGRHILGFYEMKDANPRGCGTPRLESDMDGGHLVVGFDADRNVQLKRWLDF